MQKILNRPLLLGTIVLVWVGVLFWNNHSLSLWDEDEAAYAGFAQQMQLTGNYAVPQFLWSEIHRKPPLHFWAIAASQQVFGQNEFATRVPSALAVLLTVALLAGMGRALFGREETLAACLILMASLFLTSLGKISVTDPLLLLFETLAVLSVFHVVFRGRWLYAGTMLVGIAGGLLTKGPPVLILTYGIFGVLFLFTRRKLALVALFLISFAAFVPLLLWGRAAWAQDGGAYVRWMFNWYVLRRVANYTMPSHTGPPGYYLLFLLVTFLPWVAFLPGALAETLKRFWKRTERSPFELMTVSWMASGWWIYEFLMSKSPAYVMGAFPPLALVIGRRVLATTAADFERSRVASWSLALFLVLSLLVAAALPVASALLLPPLGIVGAVAAGVIVGGASIVAYRHLRGGRLAPAVGASVVQGLGLLAVAWALVIPSLEPSRSVTKRIAEKVASSTPAGTPVVFSRNLKVPSLPFYLGRLNRPYREERDAGKLRDLYRGDAKVVLVLGRKDLQPFQEALAAEGLPPAPVEELNGFMADRGRYARYYLVTN